MSSRKNAMMSSVMTGSSRPSAEPSIRARVEEVRGLSVAALRERYREVFGEETRSGNRQWLVRRVAWRIQALAEGDLTERAKRRAVELARDVDVRLRPPPPPPPETPETPDTPEPPTASSGAGVRTGALPGAGARLIAMSGRVASGGAERLPMPGTVLRREYKGVTHEVVVLASGFGYAGKVYRSLSAVASAITGSHWNGFLFFGLSGKGTG